MPDLPRVTSSPPTDRQDPWFANRDTFDQEVKVAANAVTKRGNRAIIIGDSIALGSDGVFRDYAGSWFSKLSEISGQKIRRVRNAGVAGQATSSMLPRLQSDVIAFDPDICVLEVVTPNDIGQGLTLTQTQTNIIEMIRQVQAAGVRPIVVLGPPNDTAATRDRIVQTNAWLLDYANARGIATLDLYTPLVDVVDGTYLSTYTADGTHPNNAGQEAVATYLSTRLPADLNPTPILTSAAVDANNFLNNGLFIGDSNADGIADSWTNSGTTSPSLVARTDGLGNWQQLTTTAATQYVTQNLKAGWAIGDTLMVAGEWINDSSTGSLSVQLMFTGGTPYSQPRALSNRSQVFTTGRTFYMEVDVPPGTTTASLRLIPGIGTVRFGRVTIRKITAP